LDECSFAFRVTRQTWNEDYTERRIVELNLHHGDVSLVNFGASPHTAGSVAMRALWLERFGLDEFGVRPRRVPKSRDDIRRKRGLALRLRGRQQW
jgi:hypothetical protein